MLLALFAACTAAPTDSAAEADSAGEEPGADSAADTAADSGGDTAAEVPGLAAAGTFRGAAFAVACDASTASGQANFAADPAQVSVTCVDAAAPGSPYVVLSIVSEHPGVFVTCAYTSGGANVTVGTTDPADAEGCVADGSSAFRLQATALAASGGAVHVAGTFRYADAAGTTDVSGTFAVDAACAGGC